MTIETTFAEDATVDTSFGPKLLLDTLGMIAQLEAVGCYGTARLLRAEIQDSQAPRLDS
ncbi:MAG: hypothetical protein O3A84_12075 [Proteobacteria bacterium]|nr:hypothetical protein [Pseudomonadota bacterium]